MTAPTQKVFTVGLNAAKIYDLNDTTGYIGATTLTAYDGVNVGGPVTFEITIPAPEVVQHPGNNTILQMDLLPTQEATTGTMEVSRSDMTTIALLNNLAVRSIGDANQILWGTDKAGTEPTLGLIVYAQGKTNAGTRVWSTYVFPKCLIVPQPKGMSREQQNMKYTIQPQVATAHLTGETLVAGTDGATSTQFVEFQSNYRMHFTAWSTTTSSATFTLGASYPMVNTTGLTVYVDGVRSTGLTATTGAITFTGNIAAGKNVTAMYELADTVVDVD